MEKEALLDAVLGEPRGPLLARRLERVARAILLRAGQPRAVVSVQDTPAGMEVVVLLPPAGPRVRQLVIRLGSASE